MNEVCKRLYKDHCQNLTKALKSYIKLRPKPKVSKVVKKYSAPQL